MGGTNPREFTFMPTNKIVLNLKDVKHTYFTHQLPSELPNWYSDRQLSGIYVDNAQSKISQHNYLYPTLAHDEDELKIFSLSLRNRKNHE